MEKTQEDQTKNGKLQAQDLCIKMSEMLKNELVAFISVENNALSLQLAGGQRFLCKVEEVL